MILFERIRLHGHKPVGSQPLPTVHMPAGTRVGRHIGRHSKHADLALHILAGATALAGTARRPSPRPCGGSPLRRSTGCRTASGILPPCAASTLEEIREIESLGAHLLVDLGERRAQKRDGPRNSRVL